VSDLSRIAIAQDSRERDEVMHACIVKAQKEFPNVAEQGSECGRLAAYWSCMKAAGQNPQDARDLTSQQLRVRPCGASAFYLGELTINQGALEAGATS